MLLVPSLENRTLRFSEDKPALEYHYFVCSKTILGICVGHKPQTDTYDLTDPAVRAKLIDMGFVAKVREKQ